MNNQETQTDISPEVLRRRATHLKYYNKRYQTDMDFRIKETKRNSDLIMKKYNSDPEYRQRCLDAAKRRYHEKKLMAVRDKVE